MISDYIVQMVVGMIHGEIRMTVHKKIVRKYADLDDRQDPFVTDKKFMESVLGRPPIFMPDIFSEHSMIYYARLDLEPDNIILAGPVCVMGNTAEAEQFMRETHGITDMVRIPYCDMTNFLNGVLLLYYEGTGREISIQDLCAYHGISGWEKEKSMKEFHNTMFLRKEEKKLHNPYEHEERKLMSIQAGRLEELESCQKEVWTGELGKVAENPMRQEKNMAIIVIVLASRAAIRGGVSAEFAFSMADHDIIQIERMNDIIAIRAATLQYEMEFAKLVNRQRGAKNLYVKKAEEYVYLHLHESIRVSDIANTLKINPDYLTKVFQKEKGISVYKYIQLEKMREAKRLLSYSSYSISEVAAFLSFNSQSHFTKCFKKVYGETPAVYRKNIKEQRI